MMNLLRGSLIFLATLVLYLGLPMLGWGLDDLAGFFSLAARQAYALVIAGFALAAGAQATRSLAGLRTSSGEAEKRVARQTVVRAVVILLLYLALFFLPYADRRGIAAIPLNSVVRLSGAVLVAFGSTLVFLSGLYLGRQYSADVTIQKDHQLITAGPYRWIRHPRYAGLLAMALGMALVFRSWVGLSFFPVIVSIILFRIKDEEALLSREFKSAWQVYAQRTRRLIPFLY